ncbi:MAG: DNA mismatch repair endonuclease MutL [Clostridiales Family XIII bacterium]|jgi:DNA mismatch repair protein MutL|nr:DNA mismatch repair endonuclease MutL [Clostridiales Family XIII bacterium]
MSGIRQLPKEIADKIAAGEVVSAPLSAVKELVENSIDAGAGSIGVEIECGGKTFIRVTDDGSGIDEGDVRLAFAPHATSKITEEPDLVSIKTLGFRGEALSSIAAVSRLEMVTKTADARTARKVVIEGGEFISDEPAGAPDGTSVTVRDLFYNTPARLKFMKSDRSETTKIVDLMSRIAVAYPDIKIRLSTGGTVLFSTPGRGDRMRTILTVFGDSAGEDLIHIDTRERGAEAGVGGKAQGRAGGTASAGGGSGAASDGGSLRLPSLTAWVSNPNRSAKTRRNQIFFVNGRYVKDDVISGAVSDAYREFMFEGRYPLVYLFLEIDPSFVDVNVHPTKSEIKFAEPAEVREFVKGAIASALMSKAGVPTARTARQFASAKRAEREFYRLGEDSAGGESGGEVQGAAVASDTFDTSDASDTSDTAGAEGEFAEIVNIKQLYSGYEPESTGTVREKSLYEDNGPEAARHGGAETALSGADSLKSEKRKPLGARQNGGAPNQQEFRIDYLQVLGTVFGAYIAAADEDSFYLVDLHAAHERVNYELFMSAYRSGEKLSQTMLAPEVVRLPASARAHTEEWAALLSEVGFDAEIFGDGSLVVKSVPAFLGADEAMRFLGDIIESGGGSVPDNDRAVERLISRACRASVKANTKLLGEEARALLTSLASCANPYTCPHGRPVFLRYTKYELERLFKRA